MTRHAGGSSVESGWYLDPRTLELLDLPARGRLPGPERRSFVRVPLPALILVAPFVGGAWMLAAPVIGLAAAAWGLAGRAAAAGARRVAAVLSRGHLPGEAHLLGKPGRGAGPRAEMDDVERRVASRRREQPPRADR